MWVPTHLFKLVYDVAENRAWADWVENRDDARMNKPIRDEELVKRIWIECLPGISPSAGGGTISGSREGATDAAVAECGNQRTCKQMTDCAEARHSLNDCGVASLDRIR